MNKPRRHHFIPQFWIKKFATENGKIFAYYSQSEVDFVKEISSKKIMQIPDLYAT